MRLDKYLVTNGYFESRNRAIEAIKAGEVRVNGKTAKPAASVDETCKIEISDRQRYVSRAAYKLEGYLKHHPVKIEGMYALDVGSSTGGFTQVLLQKGAKGVDCVDVGSDQLHPSLRSDPRVRVFERTDIRRFQSDRTYEIIVSDVSFISLLHIIEAIDRLAHQGTHIVLLFKPQFEAGKEAKRDAKGVVKDTAAIAQAKKRFEAACDMLGWCKIADEIASISGKEGNREIVYHFVKKR